VDATLPVEDMGSRWRFSITQLLTANDFMNCFPEKSMLALIIFSFLIGFSSLKSAEKGRVLEISKFR
jgi:L-cystine uptake protein TcyP (sodium:dicarboxylate symporter family)